MRENPAVSNLVPVGGKNKRMGRTHNNAERTKDNVPAGRRSSGSPKRRWSDLIPD